MADSKDIDKSKEFCSSYPFKPDDIYPQMMADGRAFTNYIPSKQYNCQIMKNIAKKNGQPFDPRYYRDEIAFTGSSISDTHDECLHKKYTDMQLAMKDDLTRLQDYVWN